MLHYYYRYEVYDRKKHRWVRKHGYAARENKLVIGHQYVCCRFGTWRPVKLCSIYDSNIDDYIFKDDKIKG